MRPRDTPRGALQACASRRCLGFAKLPAGPGCVVAGRHRSVALFTVPALRACPGQAGGPAAPTVCMQPPRHPVGRLGALGRYLHAWWQHCGAAGWGGVLGPPTPGGHVVQLCGLTQQVWELGFWGSSYPLPSLPLPPPGLMAGWSAQEPPWWGCRGPSAGPGKTADSETGRSSHPDLPGAEGHTHVRIHAGPLAASQRFWETWALSLPCCHV